MNGPSVLWFQRRWVRYGFAAIAVWLLLVSLTAKCSHRSAYFRDVRAPRVDTDAPGELAYRLLLIGDGGMATAESEVMAALASRAREAPSITSVLYLGDNIYPAGMPPPDHPLRAQSEARLLAQVDPLKSLDVELLFLPGNHDWDETRPGGRAAVLRQEQFLLEMGVEQARVSPVGASPGPECLDRPGLRLITLDTQWWLQEIGRDGDSPIPETQVLQQLEQCLQAQGRHVVVAAHHPLHTNGPHGGFFTFVDHLFPLTRLYGWAYVPLPIIGSLYPLVRARGVSAQDLDGPENRAMVAEFTRVMETRRPLLYAAGHEHSLQVHELAAGPRFNVVSGAGSKLTPVGHDKTTLFAIERLGFIELDIDRLQVARLRAYGTRSGEPIVLWERRLGRFEQ